MDNNLLAVNTYNKIADAFTERYFSDTTDFPYINKFLSLLPKGARILDVGCGPGQFSKYIAEQGFEVEGIDLAEEMIKMARIKVNQAQFKIMDMRKLDYQNECFDGIWASYSLIHLPDQQIPGTLKEWYRVLKDHGVMVLAAQAGIPEQIVEEPLMPGEKMFMNFFTKEQLANYLRKAGFGILSTEQVEVNDPECLSNQIIYLTAKKEAH